MIKSHEFLNGNYLKILDKKKVVMPLATKSSSVDASLKTEMLDCWAIIMAYIVKPLSASFYTNIIIG